MSAEISISPLSAATGVRVYGVDASSSVSESTRQSLYKLFLDHGLLLLREQTLSPDQHIAFSRNFGELEVHPIERIRLAGYPEIIELGNRGAKVDREKQDEVTGRIPWHSDLTYTATPSRGALLYARVVPEEGGQTAFVDTAAVYDALDEDLKKRIDGLEVVHSMANYRQTDIMRKRSLPATSSGGERGAKGRDPDAYDDGIDVSKFPPVIHPLVFVHPESGRKALNISPHFVQSVVGLSGGESDSLLSDLIEVATSESYEYTHNWRVGDLVIWDNWRTMHRALGCKPRYLRVMHRTTIKADRQIGRLAA